MTAATLRNRTSKELGQMAKKKGVPGWHSMRKDELIKALLRVARAKSKAKASSNGATKNGSHRPKKASAKAAPKPRTTRSRKRIQQENTTREKLKDLAANQNGNGNGKPRKDRAVLMVRDPFWLHAYWEIGRGSIERIRAAMSEHWHTAKPTLRLIRLDADGTTNTAEQVERDITIHGGVNNWYIDVQDPPHTYRISIGYLAANGTFHTLIRSNVITTPRPGSSDSIDENWSDVAQNYEKVYAMSGGYDESGSPGDLQELFEERLRRPMGSPLVTRYGVGAEGMHNRERNFEFNVDAEMIIYGNSKPDAYVTLAGEPVKLRDDGTFTIRMNMPDRRQVLPVVASSCDGVEQRTVVLAIERNTKVMEPKIRDPNE